MPFAKGAEGDDKTRAATILRNLIGFVSGGRRTARLLFAATICLGAAAALFGSAPPVALSEATLPIGFTDTEVVGSGLSRPTAMALAPDGRIFITQQAGALRVVESGQLLAAPFLTLAVEDSGERGLLGVTFDPNFPADPYVYLYYTVDSSPPHNRVSRFEANGNLVVPGSETVVLELNDLGVASHNGGALHFGIDGRLYIAVGENGMAASAQSLDNLLGKVLRINSDGSIPTDNPFYNAAIGQNRAIWALGLRNPFTFDVQPGTGRIFINDVGQGAWEEINDGIAGSNYGWPETEGETTNPAYSSPLFAYGHGVGSTTGCAITGGAFYNPQVGQFPGDFTGDYLFADFCSGWIRRYDPATDTADAFAGDISAPVDLKVAPDGGLYYLGRNPDVLHRITYSTPIDTDGDGCLDSDEVGPDPQLGGQRDPLSVWDFMDQWTGSPFTRDRIISIGDVGAVVNRFGASGNPGGDPLTPPPDMTGYHTSADRNGSIPGQDPWDLQPPDGNVSIGDIGAAVVQFGHNCT
ncbi:MAG: PQQ-dependent sugar dehydrogenase [Dehalococcoidia bacterium]